MTSLAVTPHLRRSGYWWAVSLPEVPGCYTQVREVQEVPTAVTDALRTFQEEPTLAVTVLPAVFDEE